MLLCREVCGTDVHPHDLVSVGENRELTQRSGIKEEGSQLLGEQMDLNSV